MHCCRALRDMSTPRDCRAAKHVIRTFYALFSACRLIVTVTSNQWLRPVASLPHTLLSHACPLSLLPELALVSFYTSPIDRVSTLSAERREGLERVACSSLSLSPPINPYILLSNIHRRSERGNHPTHAPETAQLDTLAERENRLDSESSKAVETW